MAFMTMRYLLSTTIKGQRVAVTCDFVTARVLLPLWADAEPNLTTCYDSVTGFNIVAFAGEAREPQRCGKCQDRPGYDGLGRTCKGCGGKGWVEIKD